jgi:hypothetical protein
MEKDNVWKAGSRTLNALSVVNLGIMKVTVRKKANGENNEGSSEPAQVTLITQHVSLGSYEKSD